MTAPNRLGEILGVEALTVEQLSRLAKVSASTLRAIKRGHRPGSLATRLRIVAGLNRNRPRSRSYPPEYVFPDIGSTDSSRQPGLTSQLGDLADHLRPLLDTPAGSPEIARQIYQLVQSLPGKPKAEQHAVIKRAFELASAARATER